MDLQSLPERTCIGGIWFRQDAFGGFVPENPENIPRKIRVRTPPDCLPLLAHIRREKQEIFMVITLDGANQVIQIHEATKGLVNQCHIHPRETYVCAVEDRAVNIIVAHNHPSGTLEPSPEDLITTRRLAESGRLLGIPLLDHFIVSAEGYSSLRERFPDYFNPGVR